MSENERFPLFEMQQCIGRYYPIGLPYDRNYYEGYQMLNERIAAKITELSEHGHIAPWNTIINHIAGLYPEFHILDTCFHHAPSLSFFVQTHTDKLHVVERKSFLTFHLSLISNFYTYRVDEAMGLLQASERAYIISDYREKYSGAEQHIIDETRSFISKHYPEHRFVRYQGLIMRQLTGAIPHTEPHDSQDTKYPFFNFLF